MRYREGQQIPDHIEPLIGDSSMIFAAALGLLIGIALSVLAKKGKQLWLLTWGLGLVLASSVYIVFMAFSV